MASTLGSKAVGSTVKLKVNGTARDFIVVHQGRPSTLYDSSCNGTWLLQDKVDTEVMYNNDNSYRNSYADSYLHSYLNNTYINRFDTDTKSAIKQVKIPYRPGTGYSHSVSSSINGLSVKIFCLSAYEAGYGKLPPLSSFGLSNILDDRHVPIDGACLSYFSNIFYDTSSTIRVQKRESYLQGGSTGLHFGKQYWLRTPDAYNYGDLTQNRQLIIDEYGKDSAHYTGNSNRAYIRSAVIMDSSVCVDDSGNISGGKSVYVNIGGTWKQSAPSVKAGGSWHDVLDVSANIGGTWRTVN